MNHGSLRQSPCTGTRLTRKVGAVGASSASSNRPCHQLGLGGWIGWMVPQIFQSDIFCASNKVFRERRGSKHGKCRWIDFKQKHTLPWSTVHEPISTETGAKSTGSRKNHSQDLLIYIQARFEVSYRFLLYLIASYCTSSCLMVHQAILDHPREDNISWKSHRKMGKPIGKL